MNPQPAPARFSNWLVIGLVSYFADGTLQSRQLRPLSRFFPEVVAALREQLTNGVVLDGELVICVNGRLDFAALQARLRGARRSTAEPSAC